MRCLVFLIAMLGVMAGAAGQEPFPVTIEHAHGRTVIETAPQRVVTWGWGNEEALLSLGVVPVGMPFQAYGGGEDGIQPWVEAELERLGSERPTILPQANEPPFEAIAALKPDLIVAVFSGLTAEQYALMSRIAPTIAHRGEAWSAPWQDVTRTVGTALGKAEEADRVVEATQAYVAETVGRFPELGGTRFVAVNDYDGALAVYDGPDARVKFLTDIGLELAPSVAELSPKDGSFYFPVSYELADRLESDVIVTFAEEQEVLDAFLAKPFVQRLPQFRKGAVAALVGTERVAAVSPPSALSLRWGLKAYVSVLADAARKAKP